MKSNVLAKIKESFQEIYEEMKALGLKRHKKHTIIISSSVIKFLEDIRCKHENSSYSSDIEETLHEMSSGGVSHDHHKE